MKNYYCRVDIGEGIPSYDFIIKAENKEEATKLAVKELNESYPQDDFPHNEEYVEEVESFEWLLDKLTIN